MEKRKILIVDMQPIDPPVGGGRLRLLGLYHGLGDTWDATYVGTFDWPGEAPRQLQLSPCLKEIDVPLSEHHFAIVSRWNKRLGGRNVVDVCFSFMGRLSPEYVNRVIAAMQEANIVVFTHPWVYPLVQKNLTPQHTVIYDAQNFEALLRTELWDDGAAGTEMAKHVLATERSLARRADVLLTCSADDARLFHELYGVEAGRIWHVPNGVFTDRIRPANAEEKRSARAELGLEGPAAMFIGSPFPPNIQAVKFISEKLARALPNVTFLICGGVADAPELGHWRTPGNLRFVGAVTEEQKRQHLWAADAGINPMFAGSGTNIKMFDFMAAGLPVVSTPIGARGIDGGESEGLFVCESDVFPATLSRILQEDNKRKFGESARALAVERYSWERISSELGDRLIEHSEGGLPRPAADVNTRRATKENGKAGKVLTRAPVIRVRPRVGLVSTWATKCGIAEYSRHLAEALECDGWECLILDVTRDGFHASPIGMNGVTVSAADLRKLDRYAGVGLGDTSRRSRIEWLLVQHHPGFFDEATLVRIVQDCKRSDVKVIITCHNTDRMEDATLSRCIGEGARILVHNKDEVLRLASNGVQGISYLPCGVIDVKDSRPQEGHLRFPRRKDEAPVIGTFGFLRPHKGLLELIEAFEIVREIHPESSLLAMTALYPSDDSRAYLSECQSLLAKNGMDRDCRIVLDTEFHEIGHVLKRLQVCDLIVLPYHASDEGASASASVAMALRMPVITTRSKVFRDTAGFTYALDTPEPLSIASAICNILANPDLYYELESLAERYADERSWHQIAGIYEGLILEAPAPEDFIMTKETGAKAISGTAENLTSTPPTEAKISIDTVVSLARQVIAVSPLGDETLGLDFPQIVVRNFAEAGLVIDNVRKIVHSSGNKTDYIDSSAERYKHYLAAILSLPKSARILEVGAAPGHVSIAMKLAGYNSIGLNLNELWRQTYPGGEWLEKLDVREHDIEKEPLPFETGTFDAVLFTEVLEHVAIVNPLSIMKEISRVLRPGGILVFSTPNVCNISNVLALISGVNIFWPPETFYGSLDRHNREHTPKEVRTLLSQSGFSAIEIYGINDHNNWRYGANESAYAIVSALGDRHPLLRNTTVGIAVK